MLDPIEDSLTSPCGLDATTGAYLHPAVPLASLAGGGPDRREAAEVKEWLRRSKGGHLGPRAGVDPQDLASAGWGAVFSRGCSPAVREALAPLLAHRQRQAAARRETWYRELSGDEGYQPGDTKPGFLERHGAGGAGPADPRELPYFLLLVGGPEEIPFEFQHQLDVQYAVGRVAFGTPEEYASYATSVVAAETSPPPAGPRRAVLFGARHPDDLATDRMAEHLVRRLADSLSGRQVETVIASGATKERLARLLGGDETPPLLFTATHGMGFPAGHPRQREHQGALLCQDWPGPVAWRGPVPEGHYFHAEDVGGGAGGRGLAGLISFHFACHSGGTQEPAAFLARLPQRLLGHPNGGALAVVGHVERTWGHSFLWKGPQTEAFEDVLGLVLDGWPVGAALDAFGQRYATLASELVEEQRLASLGKRTDPTRAARLWTAAQDARNYLLLGDPAVRLVVPA